MAIDTESWELWPEPDLARWDRPGGRYEVELGRRRLVAVLALILAVVVVVLIVARGFARAPASDGSPLAAHHSATARSSRPAGRAAPAPAQPGTRRPVTLQWVGDITMGSKYGLPPYRGRALFAAVRQQLRAGDITVGNLEGTLTAGGADKCGGSKRSGCFAFRAPPENAAALRWAGFTLMNVANNHSFDFGATGQAQTLASLRRVHVSWTGQPGQITIVRSHGLRLAFLGFSAYPWTARMDSLAQAQQLIRRARRRADAVITIMHAGAEGSSQTHTPQGHEHYLGEDRGDTRAFAHAAVDAGSSLVVGSGPHVVRGFERYRGALIAYSLGNFASWQNLGLGGTLSTSGILRATIDEHGQLVAARVIPITLAPPGVPKVDPSQAAIHLITNISRQDFGAAAARLDTRGAIVPAARR